MVATLRGYPAIPRVTDQSPWQAALAATPGAGGESAPGPWSDNSPVQSGGTATPASGSPYGYRYSDPGAGFNQWLFYDGREGYDGTATDGVGAYNSAADVKRGWGPNGQGEYDRDRVSRLSIDATRALEAKLGRQATDQEKRQITLDQIARLHRDMDQTYGPQAWANSAFSGYDQFAQGAAQQAQPGQPPQGSVVINGGGQPTQGGNGMAMDLGGAMQSAQDKVRAAAQASNGTLVNNGTTSPNGGTSHVNGNFGQLQNFDPTYAAQAAQQDPGVAAHYLRLAQGQTGPITSRLGQFRDSLYGKAMQAMLALNGVGGGSGSAGDDMQAFLAALQSGNIGGLLNGAASRAGGADFTGQNDVDIEKILRAALALRSTTMGSLGTSLGSNDLDNMLYQQEGTGLENSGQGPSASGGLARLLQGGQYGNALRGFLGAQ